MAAVSVCPRHCSRLGGNACVVSYNCVTIAKVCTSVRVVTPDFVCVCRYSLDSLFFHMFVLMFSYLDIGLKFPSCYQYGLC